MYFFVGHFRVGAFETVEHLLGACLEGLEVVEEVGHEFGVNGKIKI